MRIKDKYQKDEAYRSFTVASTSSDFAANWNFLLCEKGIRIDLSDYSMRRIKQKRKHEHTPYLNDSSFSLLD
jgi:hypothetical protein